MPDCYACGVTAEGDGAPLWQRIYVDAHWRVAHAYDSSLPGWLVILARRHIESLAEATEEEAASLGGLVRRLSLVLQAETGAAKCYVMFFAENPQHRHAHIHVVPRMPDLPDEHAGPGIFHYLGAGEEARVPEEQRDELAARIRARLGHGAKD